MNIEPGHSSAMGAKKIVLYENGRLGNQLFQYISIRSAFPSAEVICLGFNSLKRCLDISPPNNSLVNRLLIRALGRMGRVRALRMAGQGKPLSLLYELRYNDRSVILSQNGVYPGLLLADGFFQDEILVSKASYFDYPLRDKILTPARQWIEQNVHSRGMTPYFLHLRRGDYVRWPSSKHPAVLPYVWYAEQMKALAKADPQAHFLVFTDDPPYAQEYFGGRAQVSICTSSEINDFALMTLCHGGGILSASSFAWWAAWYGRHFQPLARYIAPKYWAGWRQHDWYPPTIKTSWLQYVNVK